MGHESWFATCTGPTAIDSDNDGIFDRNEDVNRNGKVDAGETNPYDIDTDNDGIQDGTEIGLTTSAVSSVTDLQVFQEDLDPTTTTDPLDADSDDDGILDGTEDVNHNGQVDDGETVPCDPDTDNDCIQDGNELGLTEADVGPDTDLTIFQPDLDPTTTTDPLDEDSDDDGVLDGKEDANGNGRLDSGETRPDCAVNFNESALRVLFEADFEDNAEGTFPFEPTPGPGTIAVFGSQQALIESGLGENTSNLLVMRDTQAGEEEKVQIYCQLKKSTQGPVIVEWDAVVSSAMGDASGWTYWGGGLDGKYAGRVLWDIMLIDNAYESIRSKNTPMVLNKNHHFKVIFDTNEQIYEAFFDGQSLGGNIFNNTEANDFFSFSLDTFWDATAVLGIDNILIKGLPGVVLPGVNLLLLD